MVIQYVAAIFEHVVPIMPDPDKQFITQLEQALMIPIRSQGMMVIIYIVI
jgi:hypothetical protein